MRMEINSKGFSGMGQKSGPGFMARPVGKSQQFSLGLKNWPRKNILVSRKILGKVLLVKFVADRVGMD